MPKRSAPDLYPDPQNANIGSVRGEAMLERSLREYGAGRSIVALKDGKIVAGNKTYQKAVELGIPIQEVESDGKSLIVVRRTDMADDDPRAAELGIADNRTGEVSLVWHTGVLQESQDQGVNLEQFWFPEELEKMRSAGKVEVPVSFTAYGEDIDTEHQCPKCGYEWSGKSK